MLLLAIHATEIKPTVAKDASAKPESPAHPIPLPHQTRPTGSCSNAAISCQQLSKDLQEHNVCRELFLNAFVPSRL